MAAHSWMWTVPFLWTPCWVMMTRLCWLHEILQWTFLAEDHPQLSTALSSVLLRATYTTFLVSLLVTGLVDYSRKYSSEILHICHKLSPLDSPLKKVKSIKLLVASVLLTISTFTFNFLFYIFSHFTTLLKTACYFI